MTSALCEPPVYRILSIDGGGLKGVMPAAFLSAIEEGFGVRVVDHFDLIVGTSTGGIIALGLGLGVPPADILKFYQQRGPGIFGQPAGKPFDRFDHMARHVRGLRRVLRWTRRNKYDPDALKAALRDVLGTRKLGDSATRLVVPAYDSVRNTVRLYKTAHHDRLANDWRVEAVDVALATSAAPTFLPGHDSDHATGLVDGGVWANNPAAVAAQEAVALLGWPMDRVRMLSLGCTSEFLRLDTGGGLLSLGLRGRHMISFLMDAQARSAHAGASLLLGFPHANRDGMKRIDVDVPPGWSALDDASRLDQLAALGRTLARDEGPEVRRIFFDPGPREAFTPCHPAVPARESADAPAPACA